MLTILFVSLVLVKFIVIFRLPSPFSLPPTMCECDVLIYLLGLCLHCMQFLSLNHITTFLQDLAAWLCMHMNFIVLESAQTLSEQPVICLQCSSIRPFHRAEWDNRLMKQRNFSCFDLHFRPCWTTAGSFTVPASPHFTFTTNWFLSPYFICVDCRTVTRRLVISRLGPMLNRLWHACVLICGCLCVYLCAQFNWRLACLSKRV